jgi:hypothetical protein
MKPLTADASCPREAQAQTLPPDPELDRALARAIRRLIADARERDVVAEPTVA